MIYFEYNFEDFFYIQYRISFVQQMRYQPSGHFSNNSIFFSSKYYEHVITIHLSCERIAVRCITRFTVRMLDTYDVVSINRPPTNRPMRRFTNPIYITDLKMNIYDFYLSSNSKCIVYFLSSPELKAPVSFPDRLLSVVCLFVCP